MAVRLLHIADLHAGKITAKVLNRNKDLEHALEQVLRVIKTIRVDYLIIAGDVFDKAIPDADSEHLIYNFLVEVGLRGTTTVVIGGNHDSPKKLRNILPWGERFKVKVFPVLDLKKFIFTDGDVAFVNVPFVHERAITDLDNDSPEGAKVSYSEKIKKLLMHGARLAENYRYRILTAHLFFDRVKLGHTEREVTVADAYAVAQSAIPETFHYAALGHIHRYQRLEEAKTIAYYTGSLYQLDFGEAEEDKFFNLVALNDNGTVEVEKIKISPLRVLRKVTVKAGEVSKLSASVNEKGETYLWVEVEAKTPREFLDAKEKLERVLGDKLLKLTVRYGANPERGVFRTSGDEERYFQFNPSDPVEAYRAYLSSKGKKVDPELLEFLKKLTDEVKSKTK